MKCLYCNKEIDTSKKDDINHQWHLRCIKSFFGSTIFPEIDLSDENILKIAEKTIQKGLTIPGVQKKLSLHLEKSNSPRLTISNYPIGYILKPQTKEFISLPEAEYLAMCMADYVGIKTVPFALIKIADTNYAFITKRIDRANDSMLAMEDFCQLDNRLTIDKYKGSYERCAKIITKYSSRPLFDLSELFLRLVFSFVIGNSDMHLKNFSLIEEKELNQTYVLSPAYDLLPVNIILPEDNEEFALTLNGKKRNLTKNDFINFAKNIDLPLTTARKIISKICLEKEKLLSMTDDSYLPDKMKVDLKNLITSRIARLNK